MERPAFETRELALGTEPQLTLTYRDPFVPAAKGYVVIDTLAFGKAYGGVQIRKNLSVQSLTPLSRLGTIRYQMARIPMSGAKCGIDYDVEAPDRLVVLERFCRALKPLLDTVLSLGPDFGVSESDLDRVMKKIGVSSRRKASQIADGWSDDEWERYRQSLALQTPLGTIQDLRVPYYAAVAARTAMSFALPNVPRPRVAVLGFGPFAMRLARLFLEQDCNVVALAGPDIGYHARGGLRPEMLAGLGETSQIMPLAASLDVHHSSTAPEWEFITYQEMLRMPYEVLVLADGLQRLDVADVGKVNCNLVIEAAQLALSSAAETVLGDRGVLVLPNIALSLGAIVLTDAILVRREKPSASALLALLAKHARDTTLEICRLAEGLRISWREAALRVAFRHWEHLPSTWTIEVPKDL